MERLHIKISAISIALFLFLALRSGAGALPLTETIYMIPEYDVELLFRDEVYLTDRYSRKDSVSLGFGATDDLSLWIQFDYLSQAAFHATKSDIGDLFLKGKFYIGDFVDNQIHLGILLSLRVPLGKNAYVNTQWRNLSLGKYELKLGPFARFDIRDVFFINLNLFYTFREGNNENFFGGFSIDITKRETWEKVFGLNPAASNTFLSVNRLKNDYITASMALNTNCLYPFIPYMEFYGAVRVSRARIDTGSVPVEAAKYNAFLMSVGVRYFFMQAIYLGAYTVQNPLRLTQKDFTQAVYGIELSFQI